MATRTEWVMKAITDGIKVPSRGSHPLLGVSVQNPEEGVQSLFTHRRVRF
jgi:hypothetical protein